MPKPTLSQLRGVVSQIGTPRYAARLLRENGVDITDNALRMMVRGKTPCPPGIYRELIKLSEVKK
jgi:hypothetical protein